MKAVLLSIKPEYCALIAHRQKKIEIRKNRPKIKTPFKCYIYCTKGGNPLIPPHLNCSTYTIHKQNSRKKWKGNYDDSDYKYLNGKIIGEFVCDDIKWANALNLWIAEDAKITLKGTCLTKEDMYKYLDVKSGTSRYDEKYEFYAWYIFDLVMYDKPKELSEFRKPCIDKYEYCDGCKYGHIQYPSWVETSEDLDGVCYDIFCLNRLTRPPRSWCYVEGLEELEV